MSSLNANGELVSINSPYESAPAPLGIADYGEENESNYKVPYTISAVSVIGNSEIFSLGAYNGTQTLVKDPYGVSLQLNVVLQINTTSGQKDYWLQDVADFENDTHSLYFSDNIWNDSSYNANMTGSGVSGRGGVCLYNVTNHPKEYFYGCSSPYMQYSSPLSFNLPISILASTNSVNVTFAYQILTNGPGSKMQDVINYDTANITATGITNASIIIDALRQTPAGYAYDAELVFGGEYKGEDTTFTQMNATLSMSYLMPNGTVVTPYALYGVGCDTGEGAYNLETMMVNGTYTVVLGEPNFTESYIAVRIPFVRLNVSSFNHTFSSTSLFCVNSNAVLNLSITGGFAPFIYSLMDGNITMNQIMTNNRTVSFSYSPSSMGDHKLSIVVMDAAGNSISSKSIIESYDVNYGTISLIVLLAAIFFLAIIIKKRQGKKLSGNDIEYFIQIVETINRTLELSQRIDNISILN
jgi:thermopsin